MNIDKIDYINKLIDDVKVIDFREKDIDINSNFLKLKKGYYNLNNGKSIVRESVVRCSGNADAVAIFAITLEMDILLVIQPRVVLPTKNKVSIEVPAGYIEKEEDVIVAAKRELSEETGYVSNKLFLIDEYYPSLGYSGEKISIVLAMDCEKKQEQSLDNDEFVKYFKVNIDEFKYLLDNGFIIDATARLAYYRILEYLSNNDLLSTIGR